MEATRLWEERSRIAQPYVVRLRARLGEAAFANLDSYVGDHFGTVPATKQAPLPSPTRAQSINFSSARSMSYRDGDFRLDASSSSGLRVYFTGSGDCTVHGSTVHILSAGKCWVTAHQPGDSNYLAAPIIDQWFPIAKADQTIDFSAISVSYDTPFDLPLGARASSGLPVVYSAWGPCSVFGSTLRVFDSGQCSVTADQPGDRNFNAAPSVNHTFQVYFPPPPT